MQNLSYPKLNFNLSSSYVGSYFIDYACYGRKARRAIGTSRSLFWSETLMELIFNACAEFRRSPERPVNQVRSTSTLVPLGSFQIFTVCSDAKEKVGWGKQREATVSIQSLVKLQPWFPSLRWKNSLR